MDLFSSLEARRQFEELRAVFERWIAHRDAAGPRAERSQRALREESADVYRDMWGAFASWCAEHDCMLATLDAGDLESFLMSLGGTRDASLRYVRRTLQLISRVDAFDANTRGRRANTHIADLQRRSPYRFASGTHDDPLPEFLTSGEARALIQFVTQRRPSPLADARSHSDWTWRTVRDRTAVAVQLGAGLTPGEIRGLRCSHIIVAGGPIQDEPWALAVPGNGNHPARQTPLARWAARQLQFWLALRSEHGITGDMVFPATRTGKPWSKTNSHNAFRDVLQEAGVANLAGGSFKLRHTFALRQLTRHPPEQVALWLGLEDPGAMERYRRVLSQPVNII